MRRFLRFVIQVLSAKAGRPAVTQLRTAERRLRRGIRGRSAAPPPRHRDRIPAARRTAVPDRRLLLDEIPQPVTSTGNYALKMTYVIQI
jgi:hypothetical protein